VAQTRYIVFRDLLEIAHHIRSVRSTQALEEMKMINAIQRYDVKKLDEGLYRVELCDEDECVDVIIDTDAGVAVLKDVFTPCVLARLMTIDELADTAVVTIVDDGQTVGGYIHVDIEPHIKVCTQAREKWRKAD